MQFSSSQKAALFLLRRKYISSLAKGWRQQQQLQQQLHCAPQAVGSSSHELEASCGSMADITQQLQDCVNYERALFLEYLLTVTHEVKASFLFCMLLLMHSLLDDVEVCVMHAVQPNLCLVNVGKITIGQPEIVCKVHHVILTADETTRLVLTLL